MDGGDLIMCLVLGLGLGRCPGQGPGLGLGLSLRVGLGLGFEWGVHTCRCSSGQIYVGLCWALLGGGEVWCVLDSQGAPMLSTIWDYLATRPRTTSSR